MVHSLLSYSMVAIFVSMSCRLWSPCDFSCRLYNICCFWNTVIFTGCLLYTLVSFFSLIMFADDKSPKQLRLSVLLMSPIYCRLPNICRFVNYVVFYIAVFSWMSFAQFFVLFPSKLFKKLFKNMSFNKILVLSLCFLKFLNNHSVLQIGAKLSFRVD